MSGIQSLSKALGRRGLEAVAVALVVGTLTFLVTHALPGDLAFRTAAARYGYDWVSAAAADSVRIELALDAPLWQGWLKWLMSLAHFDLGHSAVSGEPVGHVLAHELGHTLLLAASVLVVATLVGVPSGLIAGYFAGGWWDWLTLALSLIVRVVPAFLLGLLMVIAFSAGTGLPAAGHGGHSHLWLPTLTLALPLAAMICRITRESMVAVATSDYVRYARSLGLPESVVILRHGLRNVAVAVVAYIGVQTVVLIEGVVVVETLFAWPGIGHALVHAVFGRDIPLLQGTALALGLLLVLINALVDVASWLIDPRYTQRPRSA